MNDDDLAHIKTPEQARDYLAQIPPGKERAIVGLRLLNRVLGNIHEQLDAAFPGLPQEPRVDHSALSTDEKIALGNENIRKLRTIADNLPALRAMDRQEQNLASEEQSRAAMTAAITRAAGRA